MAIREDVMTWAEAIARSLVYPLAFVAAFRLLAALPVIGQPRRRPPELAEGSQPVGNRVIRLPCGARARLFYPCSLDQDDKSPSVTIPVAPYCTDGRDTSNGMTGLVVGFRQLRLSYLFAHLANASSGCYMNATISNSNPQFPLLVYSHGYGGTMDVGTYFLRAIASKGIIVAAVEHTDGTASCTVLEDGTVLPFSPSLLSGREQLTRRANELLDATKELTSTTSILPVDPTKVFLGGHSFGAPSALMAAVKSNQNRQDMPLAGLILHDPALAMRYGMISNQDITVPTISYTSDEYNRAGIKYGDVTLHVKGAFHGNFADVPLWAPSWFMRPLSAVIPAAGPADPLQVHEELATSAAAFMTGQKLDASVTDGVLFEKIA